MSSKKDNEDLAPLSTYDDSDNLILRYVLKVGDLEEAVHVFVDLLGMRVYNHIEYEDGSAEGGQVHYDGHWSRTLVGYGETEMDQPCLQLTLNHGITKYTRGTHFHSIEIQIDNLKEIADVGLPPCQSRGKSGFLVNCSGYHICVVQSDDAKRRISCITLNCDDPINVTGQTVGFWTNCLGFKVVQWGADPKHDVDHLFEYTDHLGGYHCCCGTRRRFKNRQAFHKLGKGELPYLELQYGQTFSLHVRLQKLSEGVEMDLGTGTERLVLVASNEFIYAIRKRVKKLGLDQGASQRIQQLSMYPGKDDVGSLIVTDPNGLEVCIHEIEELKEIHEDRNDAEQLMRHHLAEKKKGKDAKRK